MSGRGKGQRNGAQREVILVLATANATKAELALKLKRFAWHTIGAAIAALVDKGLVVVRDDTVRLAVVDRVLYPTPPVTNGAAVPAKPDGANAEGIEA